MARVTLLLAVLLAFACGFIQVDPKSQFFVDDSGRVRLFHGVNAVYKIAPWHPATDVWDPQNSLTSEDMDNLQAWGFTAVRLGVMWPGVEWVRGVYDQDYLNTMLGIVRGLYQRGIYTIVDCHQDIFNRKYCGEGVPDWAVQTANVYLPFPEPLAKSIPINQTTGYPVLADCLQRTFAEFYVTDAVSAGFQNLYDNVNGTRDSFAGFWTAVATAFKDEPGVLGYELINEPWAGDIYRNPALIIEMGRADHENLQPMYQKLNTAIRSVDAEHIIFFEAAVSNYGRTGLTEGPGGPALNDRQAYSYHVYCGNTNRSGDPRNIPECNFEDTFLFDNKMADFKKLGCGGFMTEFGAMLQSGTEQASLEFMTAIAESHLQSWSYWQFKAFQDITTAANFGESFYDSNGQLQAAKVKTLSRTYAYAIAGTPLSSAFSPSTGRYVLSYTVGTGGTTDIFLNQQWYYPNGFNVTFSPVGGGSWNQTAPNFISVTASVAAGSELTLTVVPS